MEMNNPRYFQKAFRTFALFSIFALGLSASGCESTTAPTAVVPGLVKKPSVFILNEGSFNHANASIDSRSLSDTSGLQNLIPHLGDVGNDLEFINGYLYVVLNGSGKIYAVRPDSALKVDSAMFSNGEAPNKITQISATEAIVTQLYNPNAVILSLQTMKQTGVIQLGAGNVGVATLGNRAFISSGSDSLNVYDLTARKVTQIVKVGDDPQTVFADSAHNQILVSCFGIYMKTSSSIFFVDGSSKSVTDSVRITNGDFIGNVVLGSKYAYAIAGDRVVSIDLVSHKVVSESFIKNANSYYNGAYDATNNELYLGNAGSFSASGSVDVFDATSGVLKRSFGAGIAPAHFAFYR